MKFTAEIVLDARCDLAVIDGQAIRRVARLAEDLGFDAIGFNEHPAPSLKWLDSGGHDAFDTFVVHTFCAAVTQRIRLIPYLVVLPLRNPFAAAKASASLDVLSGGRATAGVCIGYLRSEFAALGVPYDERFRRFDEAVACMKGIWSAEGFAFSGEFYSSRHQVSTPFPVQKPHPPIWIGGNSRTVRERVARYGDGWAPMTGNAAMISTVRTPGILSFADMREAIEDLWRLTEQAGRDPHRIDVQMTGGPAARSHDYEPDAQISYIKEMESIGVSQFVKHFKLDSTGAGIEALERFGQTVVSKYN